MAQPKPDRASLSLLVLLGALTAFDPLSIDMYLPAFPQIGRDLHAGASLVELSLTSFFIGMTLGQLIYGPLSDHYGRKKPLIAGMTVYLLASFGCAFSRSIHVLILFRVLQALGGCAGMVIARAVVRDLFDKKRVAHIFSILMLVMGLAPILAPLAGGYLSEYFGWRFIFAALGGFCFITLLCAAFFLPETCSASEGRYLFRSTFRAYGELLHDRHFLGYALAGGAIYAGMFAYIAGSPFVLITLFGVRPEHYGWIFGANAVGIISFSQVNRLLLRRFDSEQILRFFVGGSALFAIGVFAAALFGHHLYALLIPSSSPSRSTASSSRTLRPLLWRIKVTAPAPPLRSWECCSRPWPASRRFWSASCITARHSPWPESCSPAASPDGSSCKRLPARKLPTLQSLATTPSSPTKPISLRACHLRS